MLNNRIFKFRSFILLLLFLHKIFIDSTVLFPIFYGSSFRKSFVKEFNDLDSITSIKDTASDILLFLRIILKELILPITNIIFNKNKIYQWCSKIYKT